MGFKIETDAGATVGWSIAPAGDVDGDGVIEILVGGLGPFGTTLLTDPGALLAADAADGAVDGVVAASNVAAQPGSFQIVGTDVDGQAGRDVSSAGDVDGDGFAEILIGATFESANGSFSGAAYLVDAQDLTAADALDGTVDGIVSTANLPPQPGSFQLIGEDAGDQAGTAVASAGTLDTDGEAAIMVGAANAEGTGSFQGAIYVIDQDDLSGADAANGAVDGIVDLGDVAAQPGSYKILGESDGDFVGRAQESVGDLDGDGLDELLVGVSGEDTAGTFAGAAYLIAGADLPAADAADGATDGVLTLGNVAAQAGSYKLLGAGPGDSLGSSVASAGDVDGDGVAELLIGRSYLVDPDDLPAADAADGAADGIVSITNVVAEPGSWEFFDGSATVLDQSGHAVASAGDVDGDGRSEIMITSTGNETLQPGQVWLVNSLDFASADAADGMTDGRIDLNNVSAQANSYELIAAFGSDQLGWDVAATADGQILASDNSSGAAYVFEGSRLAEFDGRDGAVDGLIQIDNVFCFAAGTRIATPAGEVAVEDLGPGDTVLTADGRAIPVRFVGRQTIATRFGPPERLRPVRIKAGALGEGLPHRDLTLTQDHALLIDGVLCQAGALVNGASIVAGPLSEVGASYTVYHVETDAHEVILAEGAPAETYVDHAGRQAFDNHAEYVARHGAERAIAEMPYPRVTSTRQLPPAIRRRLASRPVAA